MNLIKQRDRRGNTDMREKNNKAKQDEQEETQREGTNEEQEVRKQTEERQHNKTSLVMWCTDTFNHSLIPSFSAVFFCLSVSLSISLLRVSGKIRHRSISPHRGSRRLSGDRRRQSIRRSRSGLSIVLHVGVHEVIGRESRDERELTS